MVKSHRIKQSSIQIAEFNEQLATDGSKHTLQRIGTKLVSAYSRKTKPQRTRNSSKKKPITAKDIKDSARVLKAFMDAYKYKIEAVYDHDPGKRVYTRLVFATASNIPINILQETKSYLAFGYEENEVAPTRFKTLKRTLPALFSMQHLDERVARRGEDIKLIDYNSEDFRKLIFFAVTVSFIMDRIYPKKSLLPVMFPWLEGVFAGYTIQTLKRSFEHGTFNDVWVEGGRLQSRQKPDLLNDMITRDIDHTTFVTTETFFNLKTLGQSKAHMRRLWQPLYDLTYHDDNMAIYRDLALAYLQPDRDTFDDLMENNPIIQEIKNLMLSEDWQSLQLPAHLKERFPEHGYASLSR